MAKAKQIFIQSEDGEKIQRHTFENEVRFTVNREDFKALVAVVRNDKLTWIRNGFSA